MKPALYLAPFTLCATLLLAFVAFTARADWYPGDPHKWVQMPDESTNGIDVPSYTAEEEKNRICYDFLSDGRPIVRLRWWGSYQEWEPVLESSPPPGGSEQPSPGLLACLDA